MSAAISDFNLTKLNTKELSENLRATIEFGGNAFICGRRGSGKSEIAKQCIKEAGHREVYRSVSSEDRCDSQGFPNFFDTKNGGFVSFLLPEHYRHLIEGDKPVCVLLDEVDKADTSLHASLLEFTQFHTINGRPLPNLKSVVMTGNLISEGGSRPSLPLLDRAEKYLVEASHHHWLDWASKDGMIHPSITAFIADHPDELFGDVDPGDCYADPSPRGWHNASKLLNFGEEKRWSHRVLTNKVTACIGKKTGIKYSAYFDHYQILLPIVERIMKGEEIKGFGDLETTKQMVCCMIVGNRLARAIDTKKGKELPKEASPVGKFLDRVDPEMALITIRSQIGLERCVSSGLDEFDSFDKLLREMAKRMNS